MKALLLAGGMGTRLRPLTLQVPKCLVPIAGKPLLEYWLELLQREGVRPLINTHYLAGQVEDYLRTSRFAGFAQTVHEEKLLGTGGTLLANRAFFEGPDASDGGLLVVHADNLSRFDLGAMVRAHRARPSRCVMTLMTFVTPTPQECGIVELDAEGVVQRMHEKVESPPGDLANGAVYIFEPSIFGTLKRRRKPVIDLSTEILPGLMGRIYSFHNGDYHLDIGCPENYEKANRDFRAGLQDTG